MRASNDPHWQLIISSVATSYISCERLCVFVCDLPNLAQCLHTLYYSPVVCLDCIIVGRLKHVPLNFFSALRHNICKNNISNLFIDINLGQSLLGRALLNSMIISIIWACIMADFIERISRIYALREAKIISLYCVNLFN